MNAKFAVILLIGMIPRMAMAQAQPRVIHLWENGAPGFESRKDEPELAKDYWVRNIQNPSITVYLPAKENANGAAVLVVPGGGNRELVFNAEGRDPAIFLSNMGVAAFALKYRLAKEEGSRYKVEVHARQDAYRAMRLIRSHATEWNIDPNRVGVLGFSAGGEIANLIAYESGDGDPHGPDPIDRLNGKPNFQMLIYPGEHFMPTTIPSDAPPAFLLAANDDEWGCNKNVVKLLDEYLAAKAPVEAHLLAHGKHAFNMGYRSNLASVKGWPQRMADWLGDNGFLHANATTQP
jgi:acetyl esterase/lipase